ncbi:MAG: class F sortase [Caldilineaceae bacterium]|nr:class F sortase [Caldilineaceae bacterium]
MVQLRSTLIPAARGSARSRLDHSMLSFALLWLVSAALVLAGCQVNLIPTPTPPATNAPTGEVEPADAAQPFSPATVSPMRLAIPAIELDVAVVPMGWEVVIIDDERTTQWALPEDAVGWHVNSALPGASGRVILSGHQTMGAAPFAALAQGAVEIDQRILLTDTTGAVFEYKVIDVSEPIPLIGATVADEARAAAYVSPSDAALLTLATGWPDFSTTHRVFVVAELVEPVE